MKRKIFIIVSLFFLFFLNFQVKAQKESDMLKAREIAVSELQNNLNQMPAGQEDSYGFNSRDEFQNAELSLVICESIGHDSKLEFNRYRFIVSVNGEAKALVSYKKEGDSWIMCGFGAAGLTREVSILNNSYKSKMAVANIVRINDESFKGDFIKFDSSFKDEIPQDGFMPMVSSRESLFQKNMKSEATYSLQEIMQLGLEK